MTTEQPLISEEELDRISERGREIYETQLKPVLEPGYNGQVVAIHLDSGDYEVARYPRTALTGLRRRRPDGMMMITDVGPAKVDSLTLRMLANQVLTRHGK